MEGGVHSATGRQEFNSESYATPAPYSRKDTVMITPPPVVAPKRRFPWVILVCLVVGGSVCFMPVMMIWGMFRTPTEDDYLHNVQESPATLKDLGFTGSVIATRRDELTLYTAGEETPFYTAPQGWRIYKLAGPNRAGHLVVFEINQSTDHYRFNLVDFSSGTIETRHESTGRVISDSVVGEMSMHPLEDKVAYFVETGNRQYPTAYMNTGKLIELDLVKQTKTELAKDVVESDFTYSADGKNLYFVRSTEDPEPQITGRSLETGALTPLGDGWDCSLTMDSTNLIVYGREHSPKGHLEIKTGKWSQPETADYYFWPIATLSKTLILAESLPLTRETAHFFPPTGSISGAHLMMRLGVFEPTTHRAAILRTDLDRYEPIACTGLKLNAKAFIPKPPVK